MKSKIANCPGCGGPVTFQISSSVVAICAFCHSVVARGDKNPEDYGKIAEVVDLNSPLSIGMSGSSNNKRFLVTGRVQYRHPSGAVWNEWYLSFPGERWGWLAEVQGNLYLMFEQQLKKGATLANFDSITLGQVFEVREEKLNVTEKAIANVSAAEGEVPWAVRPSLPHPYVDLKSQDGAIGTIDFSGPKTRIFWGKRVAMEDLHLEGHSQWTSSHETKVQATQVKCPKCAGTLSLFAPNQTLRATCPNCKSLLDVSQGNLRYLEPLGDQNIKPVLLLGSTGKLFGKEYTVIGFMRRHVVYEKKYQWGEYLLYNPEVNFRWLVHSHDKHWSFVEQIDFPGNISAATRINFQKKTFLLYEKGQTTVNYVVGEFPWEVSIGEQAMTSDFICPPYMLSFERSLPNQFSSIQLDSPVKTLAGDNQEVSVSKGVYVPVEEIQKAFGLANLSKPLGVGVIQPAPVMGWHFWYTNAGFVALIMAIYYLMSWLHPSKSPDGQIMMVAVGLVTLFPAAVRMYLASFEYSRWQNSDYSPYA